MPSKEEEKENKRLCSKKRKRQDGRGLSLEYSVAPVVKKKILQEKLSLFTNYFLVLIHGTKPPT